MLSRLLGVYEEDDRAGGGSRNRKSGTWVGGPGGSKSILSEGIKELFGDVRQLVFSEWGAKMHYLDVTKVSQSVFQDMDDITCRVESLHLQVQTLFQIDTADTDTVMHEFRWGFRAEQELDKENVLEVISQVLLFKDQSCVPCSIRL